ncbi:unnamed protein product [Lampetra planeri]
MCSRLYLLYNHWFLQVLLYVFILLDLSLALFEEPAVIPLPTWLTLIDMIVYGALTAASCYAVRWSRVLRPLLLVNVTEGRQLRRAFRSIRNALPQIFSVFLLFMFSVLIFSLMALKLLGKRGLTTIDGAPYFTSYLDVVFDLYVLVTTANSPDVMMPAYNASLAFAIFFIVYILVNTYIFMSVFLAVVFNNYKKHLKASKWMLRTLALWCRTAGGGQRSFLQLADLLNIEVITLKSRPHPLSNLCPALYLSAPSRLVCHLVKHRAFVVIYDLIILVNAVFIGLDEKNPLISNSEWVFLALYLLEILMKIYVFEPRSFFSRHSFWNWFRTIINTLIRIGPAILTFGQLILLKGTAFATAFAALNYCKNNFNDVVSSFVLLVELTVVNQWHDILLWPPHI